MPSIAASPAAQAQGGASKTGLFLAACIGIFAINYPALSTPAPTDTHVSNRADAKRGAQLRHARSVRGAARKQVHNGRHGATAALVAHASVGVRRPTFGWPALVTEARKYIGTNPTALNKRWCARFLNLVLNKTGYSGTNSDAARSFASYGKRISEPQVGAIAVLSRGKNRNLGHVGIVTGIDSAGNPIVISGNHGKRVGEATYSRTRVIAYVMPVDRMRGVTQVASAGPATSLRMADRDGGLPSPISELLAAINAERVNDRPAQGAPVAPHPVARAAERVSPPRAVARLAAMPEPRPKPYRIVQQVASVDADVPQRVTAYRVTAMAQNVPLPRERATSPSAPLPRIRPQIN